MPKIGHLGELGEILIFEKDEPPVHHKPGCRQEISADLAPRLISGEKRRPRSD